MSSMTPCGYCGAEPTTSAVFSSTRSAMADTSGGPVIENGEPCAPRVRIGSRPCGRAACAAADRTMLGSVSPRSARPRSRAAFTATRIDSVPPLVKNPDTVSGPFRSDPVQPTTSDWMSRNEGNALVLSAFSCRYNEGCSFLRPRALRGHRRRPCRRPGRLPHRTSRSRFATSASMTSSADCPVLLSPVIGPTLRDV